MTGFFQRSPGNRSMIRLILFIAAVVGAIIALTGTALVVVVVIATIKGKDTGSMMGQLVLLIGGGLGVIGASEGFKVIQQRGEAKEASQGNG